MQEAESDAFMHGVVKLQERAVTQVMPVLGQSPAKDRSDNTVTLQLSNFLRYSLQPSCLKPVIVSSVITTSVVYRWPSPEHKGSPSRLLKLCVRQQILCADGTRVQADKLPAETASLGCSV